MKNSEKTILPLISIILIIFISSCLDSKPKDLIEKKLISFQGRDTVTIDLMQHKNSFVGKYKVTGPGNFVVTGEVKGDVKADTLVGSLYYTPFGWREKKRKAFALLASGKQYFQGKGTELIYMGIPYFVPGTVRFDNKKDVFQVVE